jgi:hypothetical protein
VSDFTTAAICLLLWSGSIVELVIVFISIEVIILVIARLPRPLVPDADHTALLSSPRHAYPAKAIPTFRQLAQREFGIL